MLLVLLRILLIATVVAAAVQACRAIHRRSPLLGWVVVVGLGLRVAAGTLLFAVSYSNAEMLSAIHSGDGFWDLAPDARVYFQLAATVASQGLDALPFGSPSPFYASVLGLWLAGSGVYVLNAVLFNAMCYVATCVAIVFGVPAAAAPGGNAHANERLLFIAIASVTFSPLLVLTSTQVLKDPFFMLLVVLACVAALNLLRPRQRAGPPVWRDVAAWAVLATVVQFGIAGIRAYYAAFVWAAFAAAALVLLWASPHGTRLRSSLTSAVVLIALWIAFMVGAGPYYVYYADVLQRTTGVSIPVLTGEPTGSAVAFSDPDASALGSSVVALRRGFVRSGGATNLEKNAAADDDRAGINVVEVAQQATIGLLAMLLPMTLLELLSIVDVSGGRGFLFITDIDTIFATGFLVAAVLLAWRSRGSAAASPAGVVFICLLAGACAVLMAYIVTNYGTLFRLRVIATAPVWLLPLALAGRQGRSE